MLQVVFVATNYLGFSNYFQLILFLSPLSGYFEELVAFFVPLCDGQDVATVVSGLPQNWRAALLFWFEVLSDVAVELFYFLFVLCGLAVGVGFLLFPFFLLLADYPHEMAGLVADN